MTSAPVVAIVLAGGRSRRFGSDKLAAVVDGRPLLDLVAAAVRRVAPSALVVLAPDDERSVPGDAEVVRDRRPHEGPLAGLAAGLTAVADAGTIALVVGGDMPTLRDPVLRRLIETVEHGAAGAVLHDGEVARPLPAAYRVGPALVAADRLLDAGERRLRALPEAVGATVIPLTTWEPLDPSRDTLRDIDVRDDLSGVGSE